MAPLKKRRPRPVRGRLPGQGDATDRQRRTGPKKPWSRGVDAAKRAANWIDPFGDPF